MKRYIGAVRRLSPAIFILLCGAIAAEDSAPWITPEEQDQIVQRLHAVLPAGSIIKATAVNRTPDEWYTLDSRGFEIDGRDGDQEFRIWFLPRDWIGIRRVRPERQMLVYWEGVLLGADYKTITETDSIPVYYAIQRLGMRTASLVNSGWHDAQEIYKERLPEAAAQAQLLVTRFCQDAPCKEEAAYSLIVLGVPAKSITLDCAEHATGRAQEFCVTALGFWKGEDSVRALERVLSDPASSPRLQNYAAISLEWIADPASGPVLLKFLRTVSHREAAAHIAGTLGAIRYDPAAPEILAQLQKESIPMYQPYYTQALATLRYQPAVPAIRKLCQTTQFSAEWILNETPGKYVDRSAEIALMRLTAPWGPPANGIRLLLLAPENPRVSARMRVAAVIENVGDRDLNLLWKSGDVVVDGTPYAHRDTTIQDGDTRLRMNQVAWRSVDLTGLITEGGLHHIVYRFENATSNELALNVPGD